jgi:hypothetical protein
MFSRQAFTQKKRLDRSFGAIPTWRRPGTLLDPESEKQLRAEQMEEIEQLKKAIHQRDPTGKWRP